GQEHAAARPWGWAAGGGGALRPGSASPVEVSRDRELRAEGVRLARPASGGTIGRTGCVVRAGNWAQEWVEVVVRLAAGIHADHGRRLKQGVPCGISARGGHAVVEEAVRVEPRAEAAARIPAIELWILVPHAEDVVAELVSDRRRGGEREGSVSGGADLGHSNVILQRERVGGGRVSKEQKTFRRIAEPHE